METEKGKKYESQWGKNTINNKHLKDENKKKKYNKDSIKVWRSLVCSVTRTASNTNSTPSPALPAPPSTHSDKIVVVGVVEMVVEVGVTFMMSSIHLFFFIYKNIALCR